MRLRDFNDSRTGRYGVVRDRFVAGGQDHVALTGNRRGALGGRGDGQGKSTVNGGGSVSMVSLNGRRMRKSEPERKRDILGENRSCDCDERPKNRRMTVRCLQGVARSQEGDFRARSDVLRVLG